MSYTHTYIHSFLALLLMASSAKEEASTDLCLGRFVINFWIFCFNFLFLEPLIFGAVLGLKQNRKYTEFLYNHPLSLTSCVTMVYLLQLMNQYQFIIINN